MVPRGFLTSKGGIPHPQQVRDDEDMLSQQVTKPLTPPSSSPPHLHPLVSGLVPPTDPSIHFLFADSGDLFLLDLGTMNLWR